MKAGEMFRDVPYEVLQGEDTTEVSALVYDSREVVPGCMFVCISGTTKDAHEFIPQVVEMGAKVIVVEREVSPISGVTILKTQNNRKALACLAAAWFGYPGEKLTTIGITGTKGKTTTSYMIASMLQGAGKKVGIIGTLGAMIGGVHYPTRNTTPESYEVQELFSKMTKAHCDYCIMEVSSQGLMMDRVAGIVFDYGIFTNFSPDHIGPKEHTSLEEYRHYKSLLFHQSRCGILNRDDPEYAYMAGEATCPTESFGFHTKADLHIAQMEYLREKGVLGIQMELTGVLEGKVMISNPGRFSAYNGAAALAVGEKLGLTLPQMAQGLGKIHVPGRVEMVPVPGDYTLLIDYAHNAASVESLLTTIKEYHPRRILCVYGCGGNRSKLRRYDMGELCGKMADLSILTCDNPRDEEVEEINKDIKVGLSKVGGNYCEIPDRKDAIHFAMEEAGENDVVLLLGKGHETYQEIKGVKYPFCEREIVEAYGKEKGK